MNKYIGHPSQLFGVEESIIVGGKGDGMKILTVRNGKGLEFVVSADRCADIPKVYFKGDNLSYIAPCGYVGSKYFDKEGNGFLKSFTAGFLTTCGLNYAGATCCDNGENLSLHGTISNTPAENIYYHITDSEIIINAEVRDASLFSYQMVLNREYRCSLNENKLIISDKITNISSQKSPYMILYHFNMGYPLVSENAQLEIPSTDVKPRNEHSEKSIENWMKIDKPTRGFEEKCYYHVFDKDPVIKLYNPDINKGIRLSFFKEQLAYFTEWQMFGDNEYVVGLEPANCYPDGRKKAKENNELEYLNPNEYRENKIILQFFEK